MWCFTCNNIPKLDRKRMMFLITRHYDKTHMQYTVIFHGCKNDNFQMKNCDFFLILAQNIDHGYTLQAVLTNTHNLCLTAKIRKNVCPCKPQFYYIKVGCKGVNYMAVLS